MSVFVASYVAIALVSGAGLAITALLAGIPLPILARAQLGGRYAGLASGARRVAPVGPASGHRVPGGAALRGTVA
jgi:hypothetical protein